MKHLSPTRCRPEPVPRISNLLVADMPRARMDRLKEFLMAPAARHDDHPGGSPEFPWSRGKRILRGTALAAMLSAIPFLPGCGTIMSFGNNGIQEAGIYSGLRLDIKASFLGELSGRVEPLRLFFILDIPLSLGLDTVLLPAMVILEVIESSRDYDGEWRCSIEAGDRALKDGLHEEANRHYGNASRIAYRAFAEEDPRRRQTLERYLNLGIARTERAKQEHGENSREFANELFRQSYCLRSLQRYAEANALQSRAHAILEQLK